MSVQLATVDIVFGDTTNARPSIQRGIFIARHNYFPERYREYQSLNAVAEDVPTTSSVYIAAQSHFAQDPALDVFGVGRFETISVITPEDATTGKEYGLTLLAKDAAASITVSYTAVALDTQEEIVDALIAAIQADTDTAAKVTTTKVGVGADAVMQLSHAVTNDWFVVSDLVSVTESFPSVPEQTAADELVAITQENDNWYYVTTDVKEGSFVEALALDLSARFNFYAVSLAEATAYNQTGLAGTLGALMTQAYDKVYPIYHHDADKYPEVGEMSEYFALADTGITMANRNVAGVSESLQVDGKKLTDTQIANLKANGINFFNPPKISGSTTAQQLNRAIVTGRNGGGRVCSGEYSFNVVGKDAMTIELEANLTDLLTSQKIGRLTWTQEDLDKVYGMIDKALVKFADPNGWDLIYNKSHPDFPYYIERKTPRDFSAAVRQVGKLTDQMFRAYLKDAIHEVEVIGNLTRPQ